MEPHLFEEHHEVLAHWVDRGLRDQTVICFDAHLDLQRVNEQRLDLLRVAVADRRDIRSVAKPHFLMPDTGTSFSIEDFFYPAHRLGVVKHLVWVAPTHVAIETPNEAIRELSQLDGVTPEALESARVTFVRGYPVVQAELLDLELTIARAQSLGSLGLPSTARLDFDVDYFVHVPGDRLGASPREVAELVSELEIDLSQVTLSRSLESGFTPARLAFLPELLVAYFLGDQDAIDHFERLLRVIDAARQGHSEFGDRLIREELARFPTCAATRLLAAECDGDRREEHLAIAATIDPRFTFNPLRMACEYLGRRLPIDSRVVNELERWADTLPREQERDALTAAAIGLLRVQLGDIGTAIDCLQATDALEGGCRELALGVGHQLLQLGLLEQGDRAAGVSAQG